jgi:hypothetical protein
MSGRLRFVITVASGPLTLVLGSTILKATEGS